MFEQETLVLKAGSVLFIPPGINKACTCPNDNVNAFFFMIRQSTFSKVFWAHLSAQFGYSTRQIIRILHSVTGKSFSQLQTELRMQKAARMLTSRAASMEEISAETGFANLSSFYRAFKRYYSCTPKEYASLYSPRSEI